jgi:type I restriction enzyme M protein
MFSVSGIAMGEAEEKARDLLVRVYEYFLGGFAGSEGKRGVQFYTPLSVVRVLVEMLEPYRGRVYDPCCDSRGMFVSSEKCIEAPSVVSSATSPSAANHDIAAIDSMEIWG